MNFFCELFTAFFTIETSMNKTRLVLALTLGLIVTATWGTRKKAATTGNSLVINEMMASNVDEFIMIAVSCFKLLYFLRITDSSGNNSVY